MLLQTREGESESKQAAWGSQIECAVSAAEAVGFKPPRPLPPALGSPVPVSTLTYEKPQPGEAGRGPPVHRQRIGCCADAVLKV